MVRHRALHGSCQGQKNAARIDRAAQGGHQQTHRFFIQKPTVCCGFLSKADLYSMPSLGKPYLRPPTGEAGTTISGRSRWPTVRRAEAMIGRFPGGKMPPRWSGVVEQPTSTSST